MDDVQGRFSGLPHGTTPAAVTTNKNINMSSFKSSENIQKKKGRPDSSRILPKFELIQAFIVVLITCKNEEEPIKNEGARVLTRFSPL